MEWGALADIIPYDPLGGNSLQGMSMPNMSMPGVPALGGDWNQSQRQAFSTGLQATGANWAGLQRPKRIYREQFQQPFGTFMNWAPHGGTSMATNLTNAGLSQPNLAALAATPQHFGGFLKTQAPALVDPWRTFRRSLR